MFGPVMHGKGLSLHAGLGGLLSNCLLRISTFFCTRFMETSSPAPPRLLELAAHSPLSSEASPLPALEEFTVSLFPPLLPAAFAKGHKKALKALVHAWPFPFLRLGSLIVQWPNQDSLQAVLDGLEVFPACRACPR